MKVISTITIVVAASSLTFNVAVNAGGYPIPNPVAEPSKDYPGSFAPFNPPSTNMSVHVGAPQIVEWTRENLPGDTLALVGENLSMFSGDDEGKDTGFDIYAEGSEISQGLIERLDGRVCSFTLPEALPSNTVYLVWPSNRNGFGAPFAVNKAEAWWVGFDEIEQGDQFYVYGRNLELGEGECHLYYTNYTARAGGWIASTDANPYRAGFVMPLDAPAGDYTIWVHNGRGHKYGWSEPLELLVEERVQWTGPTKDLVADFGANGSDANDDQAAFDACKAFVDANPYTTVTFPEGTFYLSGEFDLRSDTRYVGAGVGKTVITATSHRPETGDDVFIVGRSDYEIHDLTILLTDSLLDDAIRVNETWSHDILWENVVVDDKQAPNSNHGLFNMNKAKRVEVKNCKFIGKNNVYIGGASYVRMENCQFIGIYDNNQLATINGGTHIDINGCDALNFDHSDASSSFGWCKGRWIVDTGGASDIYLGENTTSDLLPRKPTPFWAGGVVDAVGSYENEQNYWYGDMGEQVLSVVDIPDKYHGMGDDSIPWSGTKVVVSTSSGDQSFLVRKLDALNNRVTIQIRPYTTPLVHELGMTVGLKDITDQNASEQYLLEGNATRFTGRPVGVSANSVTFDSPINSKLSECAIAHVVKGRGFGQVRRIQSVDEATGKVVFDEPWAVLPTTDSIINMGGYAYRYVFYKNTFDGRPEGADPNGYSASAGMQSGGGSSDMVFVGNTFSEVRQGLWFRSKGNFDTYPDVNVMSQNIFNYAKGNHFKDCMLDIALSTSSKGGKPVSETDLCSVGNVFRGNDSTGAHRAFSISPADDGNGTWVKLNVFQDNTASDFTTSIYEETGVENQVWVGNSFYGLGSGYGYEISANHVPVLRNNTWEGFSSTYGGDVPGGILELPIRGVALDDQLTGVQVPVWNSGSASLSWSVESVMTADGAAWLDATVQGADLPAEGGVGWLSLTLSGASPSSDTSATVTVVAGGQRKRLSVGYSILPTSPDDFVVEYDVTYDFEVKAVLSNMATEEEVVLEVMQNPSNYKLRIPRHLTSPGNTYEVIFQRRSPDNPSVWIDLPEQQPNFRM